MCCVNAVLSPLMFDSIFLQRLYGLFLAMITFVFDVSPYKAYTLIHTSGRRKLGEIWYDQNRKQNLNVG